MQLNLEIMRSTDFNNKLLSLLFLLIISVILGMFINRYSKRLQFSNLTIKAGQV